MTENPLAFSTASAPGSSEEEEKYETLHAAVAESAHGRWFLQEYARRHRAADTRLLLDAIARLERFLTMGEGGEPSRHVYAHLLDMAKAIAQTRAQVEAHTDTSPGDEDRARKITALFDHLQSLTDCLEPPESGAEIAWSAAQERQAEGAAERNEEGVTIDTGDEFQERHSEAEMPKVYLDAGAASSEPIDVLPFAVKSVASEIRNENESFALELEPLRVEPLLAAEPECKEPCSETAESVVESAGEASLSVTDTIVPGPEAESSEVNEPVERTGAESLSIAAELAALAASLSDAERPEKASSEDPKISAPAREAHLSETALLDEQIGSKHAHEFLLPKEPLLVTEPKYKEPCSEVSEPALESAVEAGHSVPAAIAPESEAERGEASEPQEGAGAESLLFAALATSLSGAEGYTEGPSEAAETPMPPDVDLSQTPLLDEQIGWKHATESSVPKEPLLLLCDQTGRKLLPALASLYLRPAFPTQAEARNEDHMMDLAGRSGPLTEREREPGQEKIEPEELTLEPLSVHKRAMEPEPQPVISVPGISAEGAEPPEEIDTLSTAWISQISKPVDEALAGRRASKEEAASEVSLKGLGAPPRSAMPFIEQEELSADSILEIEEELFAPAYEITQAHSEPKALPASDAAVGTPTITSAAKPTRPASGAVSAHTGLRPRATRGISHAMPRGAPNDPLAPIRSLSDEELIALFT